jgi:hypothetical protein
LTRITRIGANANALKALRKLAQGWLVAPESDEGGSETTLGNSQKINSSPVGKQRPRAGNDVHRRAQAGAGPAVEQRVERRRVHKRLDCGANASANPAREVKDINGIACTAAACQSASDAIVAADKASNQSNTDAGNAQAAYQDDLDAARARASGLLSELDQLLDDSDPRWLAFGFDLPGHPGAPDVPQNLTVTAGTPGSLTLYAHCDDARRADGYRFTVNNAADNSTLAEQLTQDAEATFNGLPSGAKVNVIVTARNATGESQPCDAMAAVVP